MTLPLPKMEIPHLTPTSQQGEADTLNTTRLFVNTHSTQTTNSTHIMQKQKATHIPHNKKDTTIKTNITQQLNQTHRCR